MKMFVQMGGLNVIYDGFSFYFIFRFLSSHVWMEILFTSYTGRYPYLYLLMRVNYYSAGLKSFFVFLSGFAVRFRL